MEEKIIEEPILEPEAVSNEIEKTDAKNLGGSIYGKFKDAKTLLDAYNSLQGEFTRKSQKLAEMQKKIEENAFFTSQNENLEDVLNGQTDSEQYKKEIEEMLAKNENISNLPNKYRVAFEMVKTAKDKLATDLNSPEFYDKYISKNENIKTKIIGEYLSSLNNIKVAPKMISGNSASVHFAPVDKPKTVKEAGEIFSKMLK